MAGIAGESFVLRSEGSRGAWEVDDDCAKSSTFVVDDVGATLSWDGFGNSEALAGEPISVAM